MPEAKVPTELQTTFATYQLTKKIGQGGAGSVYEALDSERQPCAIKVLDPGGITTEKRRRFKNEIAFCQRHDHPNIVKILDHGLVDGQDGRPFYVMRLYSGSLRSLLKSGVSPDKALKYVSQMLDGVEAAHLYGVLHRDIKPENFLYDETNDNLVIADFGIARFCQEELYTLVETKDSARLANFQYAAPEQRARGVTVELPADIYALGLILNELYTGTIPIGTNYRTIQSIVPELAYLDDLVAEMIRQQPSDRPQPIDAIKRMLIGRKNDFIERQRLSELDREVVPTTDLDDELLRDPPRLISFEWKKGTLTLILSRPINARFVWALRNMNSASALWGKGPEAFGFSDNTAIISAQENQVQLIIDHFKDWLPRAIEKYKWSLEQEKAKNEAKERERMRQEVEELERQQRLRRSIKI